MRIEPARLREAVQQILLAAGVDTAQANTVSHNIVWCDMAGRSNYGVSRLPALLKRVAAGVIKCPCEPKFERFSESIEKLHADNGFGHHASSLAIDRACDLAEQSGLGIVGVAESNFFGAGAYYVLLAAERGMASIALSNSVPQVTAPGGNRPVLGTNPIAFGAPRKDGHALLLDMSTAAMASSSVRATIARGGALAKGIAIDQWGNPLVGSVDTSQFTLLPAAGAKGYALSVMIEILSGVLSGAGMSHGVASMYRNFNEGGHNGHFFLALDVSKWMPVEEYFARIEVLATLLAEASPGGEVRLPGAERWNRLQESDRSGVLLETETSAQLEALAREHGVIVPWSRCRSDSNSL